MLRSTYIVPDWEPFENQPYSMAWDGTTVVLGAIEEDQNGGAAGTGYTYDLAPIGDDPEGLTTLGLSGETGDEFGAAVDLDLNDNTNSGRRWKVVGAPAANGTGEAYLFERLIDETEWTLIETFAPSDGSTGDRFGASVAVAGVEGPNTPGYVIVGAPDHDGNGTDAGAVYVYQLPNNIGSWALDEKLVGASPGDRFGAAIDYDPSIFNGGVLLVGAPSPAADGRAGEARLYNVSPTAIEPVATIVPGQVTVADTDQARFGAAVAIDRGELFAIGAPDFDGVGGSDPDGGAVFVYQAQLDYPGILYAGPVAPKFISFLERADLGLGAGAAIGTSVSAEPNRVAVGAPGVGSVVVVEPGAGGSSQWAVADTLVDPNGQPDFGAAVDLEDGDDGDRGARPRWSQGGRCDRGRRLVDGSSHHPPPGRRPGRRRGGHRGAMAEDGTVAVGAPSADTVGGTDAGGVWNERIAVALSVGDKVLADGAFSDGDVQQFGGAIDSDGTRAIVGAGLTPGPVHPRVGTAYVLERVAGEWVVAAELPKPTPQANNDGYGRDVAIDGTTAMVVDWGNGIHVWEEEAGGWEHRGLFALPDQPSLGGITANANASFIDLDGDTAIVGDFTAGNRLTYGHVLERTADSWAFAPEVLGPSERSAATPVVDTWFGRSVAVDGEWIAIAATRDNDAGDNAGAVYVYRDVAGTWTFTQKLTGLAAANHRFGEFDVAIDGSAMVVGARLFGDSEPGQGTAWIVNYDPVADVWRDTAPPDDAPFDPLDPVNLRPAQSGAEWFGFVDLDGDVAAVGSGAGRVNGQQSVEAVAYRRDGTGRWRQSGQFIPADHEAHDRAGDAGGGRR